MAAPAGLEARREETAVAEAEAAGHGAQGPREPQEEDRQVEGHRVEDRRVADRRAEDRRVEGRMGAQTVELSLPRGAEILWSRRLRNSRRWQEGTTSTCDAERTLIGRSVSTLGRLSRRSRQKMGRS